MEISQIFAKDYPNNKNCRFTYRSDYYYDVTSIKKAENTGWTFDWEKKRFPAPYVKILEENIFQDYIGDAEYYLGYENGEEMGLLVLGYQSWNKAMRVWNFGVADNIRHRGFGTELMKFAEQRALRKECRVLVLECQSCNYPAIQFYRKYGFELTGFDLVNYSNEDAKKKNVRFEMSKLL